MLWVCVRVQKTIKSIKKLLILIFLLCVCIAYAQAKKIIVNSL